MKPDIDQWNIIENPKIKPHSYGHPVFDKGVKEHSGQSLLKKKNGIGQIVTWKKKKKLDLYQWSKFKCDQNV